MPSALRFLESELAPAMPEQCRFHIIPVPFEASVSYGTGAGRGPEALLRASSQLELWTGECNPSEEGIYTWPAVDGKGSAETVLGRIEAATDAVLALPRAQGALPVLIGGEHTATLGALRSLRKRYGHFGIIQFDAHADLRRSYAGSMYSHACVMRRAMDDLGLRLFQVAVRSLSLEEERFRREASIPHLDARIFAAQGGMPGLLRATSGLLPEDFPRTVFLTFDVDALDCSIMPATGTPEPGGLSWWEALALARLALAGRRVIGCDVMELAPLDNMEAPTFTAARLTYELLAAILLSS